MTFIRGCNDSKYRQIAIEYLKTVYPDDEVIDYPGNYIEDPYTHELLSINDKKYEVDLLNISAVRGTSNNPKFIEVETLLQTAYDNNLKNNYFLIVCGKYWKYFDNHGKNAMLIYIVIDNVTGEPTGKIFHINGEDIKRNCDLLNVVKIPTLERARGFTLMYKLPINCAVNVAKKTVKPEFIFVTDKRRMSTWKNSAERRYSVNNEFLTYEYLYFQKYNMNYPSYDPIEGSFYKVKLSEIKFLPKVYGSTFALVNLSEIEEHGELINL